MMKRMPFRTASGLAIGCLALFGSWWPLVAQNPVPEPSAPSKPECALTVTVVPHLTCIYSGEQISLLLRVTNASPVVQTFQVMSCSWPTEWKSSGARLYSQGFACAANAPITIVLAPHADYEKTLLMNVGAMPKGKVDFSMGFTPLGSAGARTTYWSNKMRVQVN